MTTYYLDSAAGSNTSPYSTWATAATALSTLTAIMAAGDIIYVASTHSESIAAATTYTFPGTPASPNVMVCADKTSGAPPTTVATGASITTTGASTLNLKGSFYCYGVTWTAGNGLSTANFQVAGAATNDQYFDNCTLAVGSTSTSARLFLATGSSSTFGAIVLRNCTLSFGNVSQGIDPIQAAVVIKGGSLSGSAITTFIPTSPSGGFDCEVDGFDFSAAAAGMNFFVASTASSGDLVVTNSKLPTSWSGAIFAGAPTSLSARGELHLCDDAATNYVTQAQDYAGSQAVDTAHTRSSGATDGTTAISWKVVSSANSSYPSALYRCISIAEWNDTTGTSKTATVEICQEGGSNLNNNDIWMELYYMGSTATPLASIGTCEVANYLTAAAAQPTSTATWAGFTTPTKQKLQVTFTPQMKGYIVAKVFLAKASSTIYVDPLITVA